MKLYRKEVLEQKVRTLLNSVNFSRKLKFKVTFTVSWSWSWSSWPVRVPVGGGAAPGRPPARPAGVPREERQGGRLQLSEGRTGADRLCRHRRLQVIFRHQPPSHRQQYLGRDLQGKILKLSPISWTFNHLRSIMTLTQLLRLYSTKWLKYCNEWQL